MFIFFMAISFFIRPFIKNKYFDEIIRVEGRNKGRHRLSLKLVILFNKATAKVLRLKDSRFSAEDAKAFRSSRDVNYSWRAALSSPLN